MQQGVSSVKEQETFSDNLDQRPLSKKDALRMNEFCYWPREDQLEAFLAWLPRELADIPGID